MLQKLKDYPEILPWLKNPEDAEKYTIGSSKSTEFQCKKCLSEFSSIIKNFIKSPIHCPFCIGKRVNHTNDLTNYPEILPWIKDPEDAKKYTIGSEKTIMFHCKECNEDFTFMIKSFTQGKPQCPFCIGRRVNHKNDLTNYPEIVEAVKNKDDLIKYTYKSGCKIWFNCKKCNSDYNMRIVDFSYGNRCSYCAGKRTNKTNCIGNNSEFQKYVYNKGDLRKYTLKSHHRIDFKCDKCNSIYNQIISKFTDGSRCQYCAGYAVNETNDLNTGQDFSKWVLNKDDLSKYTIGSGQRIMFCCPDCKHEFKAKIVDFKWGSRCPKCNKSRGEKLVQEYLTEHGYAFNEQHKFMDCKIQNCLPFDFVLLDEQKTVIGAIEYQGEQHYRIIDAWGGEENLKQIQLRDQIKREYCQNNNIPLLEIHYQDKDKTRTLQNFLDQIFPTTTK